MTRSPQIFGSEIWPSSASFFPTGVIIQFGANNQPQQNQDVKVAWQSNGMVDVMGYWRFGTPSLTGTMFMNMVDVPWLLPFSTETYNYMQPLGTCSAIHTLSGATANAVLRPNASTTQFYFSDMSTNITWTQAVPWTWAITDEIHYTLRYMSSRTNPYADYV